MYCYVDLHISVYTRKPWEQSRANRLTTRKMGKGPRRVRDKSFQITRIRASTFQQAYIKIVFFGLKNNLRHTIIYNTRY